MLISFLLTLLISALQAEPAEPVRIGLFRLFAPETVSVRVAAGGQAAIYLRDSASSAVERISDAETLLITCKGGNVDAIVTDSAGRWLASVRSPVIVMVPGAETVFEVSVPGKISRRIRGELVVSGEPNSTGGKRWLSLVMATDVESAVGSIVAAELNGIVEEEARKALEVACRSYLLAHRGRHSAEGFDFCDTTHCQLYQGDATGRVQAPATRGEVITFEGRVVEGYYTAVCGGRTCPPNVVWGGTEASGYPYRLIRCNWCRRSAHWRWRRSADAVAVFEAVSKAIGRRISSAAEIVLKTEHMGRFVNSVEIRHGRRRFALQVDEFRRAVGKSLGWNTVLSPSFTVQRRGQRLIFEGRGFGSQVGLCVAGARGQAEAGRSYRDILSFYYPGAQIEDRRNGC